MKGKNYAIFFISLFLGCFAYALAPNTLVLKPNQQTVNIALPANATTGYQWFVKDYNRDLLSLQDYRYNRTPSKPGVVGSGGMAVFSFTVDPRFYDGPQTTVVNFVYQQPWNPGQNTTLAQVTLLSLSSSSDLMSWQKYPELSGPLQSLPSEASGIDMATNPATPVPVTVLTVPSMQNASPAVSSPPSNNISTPKTPASSTPPPPSNSKVAPLSTPSSTPNAASQTQWLNLTQTPSGSTPPASP